MGHWAVVRPGVTPHLVQQPLGVTAVFFLALLFAALDWSAVAAQIKPLEYVFKPLTLLAIITTTWLLSQGPHDTWQSPFFVAGLTFSLGGDVLLMLPGQAFFLAGLVAFLAAHLAYIAGLNPSFPPITSFVLLLPIGAIGLILFRRVSSALPRSGGTTLLAPIAVYSLVLSLMLFSAWATLSRPEWTPTRRALVIVGATLFYASDTMLAWNRFVAPSQGLALPIIITYHLGQMALAASTSFIP